VLELPGDGVKDASDWISEGGTRADLEKLARAVPKFERASPEPSTPLRQLVTKRMSEVQTEKIEWLWLQRIPLGKLTLLEGDPGLGKSTIACAIAAAVSTGCALPEMASVPSGSVIIFSAEDGLADTIRPRLDAAGADSAKCHAVTAVRDVDGVEGFPGLPVDIALIEATAMSVGARLIIIDPLMSYLEGKVDSHKDQHVRRAMAPLSAMAERTKAAVLVILHLNKGAGRSPIYRGGGSIGIGAAARSVLVVAKEPGNETEFVLAPVKSNLGPSAESLKYRLTASGSGAARVEWLGVSEYKAEALLAAPMDPEERSKIDDAKDFLRQVLAARAVDSDDVKSQANGRGISSATLRRAKDQLKVRSGKAGFSDGWQWSLPSEDAHAPQLSTFGNSRPMKPNDIKAAAEDAQGDQARRRSNGLSAFAERDAHGFWVRTREEPGADG
jgi:putative DNA primase/helicase